jgi:hypothetical protein
MLAKSFHWCGSFKEGERWQKAAPSCASLVSNGPSNESRKYCESKDYRLEPNNCKSDWLRGSKLQTLDEWFNVLVRKPNKVLGFCHFLPVRKPTKLIHCRRLK